MAKIKTLTSMSREGVAIQNNSEIDVPMDEAVALCRNSLAQPVGWSLDGDEPSPESESLEKAGISKAAVAALAKINVKTIADVAVYIASGKKLAEIDGVSEAQAEKLIKLATPPAE